VTLAVSEARRGQIATFGVPPTRPETGFGYISIGAATGSGAWHVSGFHEKPNLELAQEFYNSKRFYWNAGMFCMRVNDVLSAFSECVPDLYSTGKSCFTSSNANKQIPNVLELELAAFSKCENISFDYAVMEKFDRVSVVPASFDWTDIGSWNALSELVPLDENGNRTSGDVIAIDVKNSYLQSDQRLIAAIGIEDLIVVDTPDALLISHQSKTQEVKQVVKQLKASGHEVATLHRTVTRPWGTYTVLESGDRYKIKRIEVRPGASLSLQMHHHRNEHWIVVSGTAKVVNGEREFLVLTNESTYIPAGHKHRLENPGVMPLVMIEVQSGEYLGEDDIVRFQDAYGRV
jgi:mannose-1-phosphate guanylyltransferase